MATIDHTSAKELMIEGSWRAFTVADMSEVMQYGSSAKTSEDASGVPVLRMGNIQDGKLDLESLKYLPHDHAEFPDLLLKDGDLLFNRTNSAELVGKSAVYRGNPPKCSCASYLIRVRLKPEFVPEYLSNYLNSLYGRQWIASVVSQQVGQANVNGSKLKALSVPVPPLADQRRIVAEIEKQFTRLEAGVAALRRVQANLKRYRAAVLKAACEGCLVPTEAEVARAEGRPFESGQQLLARILTERRQQWQGRGKYKEPEGPAVSPLPELPDGWAWATVDQLAAPEPNSITDGPFGSNLKTEHYTSNGPRVIRLQNIGDGVYVDEEAHITQGHFERLKKHRVFANDVVIAGFGENPPRSCVIPESLGPAIVKADCIRFKPHSDVLSKYMNAALNSDPVRKRTKGMVHGVGRPRLNLGEIKSIVLPLPPLAEQARIVAEVERRLSVAEELEAVVSANLQRAARLRQSILQKAFIGQS